MIFHFLKESRGLVSAYIFLQGRSPCEFLLGITSARTPISLLNMICCCLIVSLFLLSQATVGFKAASNERHSRQINFDSSAEEFIGIGLLHPPSKQGI